VQRGGIRTGLRKLHIEELYTHDVSANKSRREGT
jgi:hypothetical protein